MNFYGKIWCTHNFRKSNIIHIHMFIIRMILLLTVAQPILLAKVQLPSVFGDHMVLQRAQPIPVWGTAAPGEMVTIRLGHESHKTMTDSHGSWRVRLSAREATETPLQMVVEGENVISFDDILIGEVWLCSGQSNMHWPLKLAVEGPALAASAKSPNMRILNLRGNPYTNGREFTDQELQKLTPEKYLTGAWARATPDNLPDFSAVAFFFGRELQEKLNVPIGLIHNAIGGTPTESWVSPDSLRTNQRLKPLLEKNWFQQELVHSFCRDRAALNLRRLKSGLNEKDVSIEHPYKPGFMYRSGIASIAPFAIRGAIWYQGESNAHNPSLHQELFKTLVADWRRAWAQGDFPFYFVQLPNFEKAQGWPEFRESQRRGLAIPNTAMAVTIDQGDPADVHPPEKREVGHRLALIARALSYGENVEYSGPTLKSIHKENKRLRLKFLHVQGGLTTLDKTAFQGFEISGKDRVFIPALSRIEGDEIVLEHPDVENPFGVRYGFAQNPHCNMANQSNLPASPFVEFLD